MNKINYSDPRRSVPDTVSTILALVLGIVGLILALLAFLPCLGWVAIVPGLLCAILAIILGAVAVKRSDDRTYGSARGALTCGCVGLVIIIGAIIYQGMILAPVMKQADAHTEEIRMDGLQRCEGGAEGNAPQRMRGGGPCYLFDRPSGGKKRDGDGEVPGGSATGSKGRYCRTGRPGAFCSGK